MREIGKLGGIMDAKDVIINPKHLEASAIALITDPALNAEQPEQPRHTAGTTFMGQFLDHDMTFDLTSRLGVPTEPEDSVNTRTPSLDLDSVYGGGPDADPELYDVQSGDTHPSSRSSSVASSKTCPATRIRPPSLPTRATMRT